MQIRARKIFVALFVPLLLVLPSFAHAQGGENGLRTLITGDRLLSLQYPEDWTVGLAPTQDIILATDARMLEAADEENSVFAPGEISLVISFIATEYPESKGLPGDTKEHHLNYLLLLLSSPVGEDETPDRVLGPIESVQLSDGREALQASFTLTDKSEGKLIIWDISEDLTGLGIMTTALGETQMAESTVLPIIESVEFSTTIEAMIQQRLAR